jgi:hypothetical protein
MPPICFNAGISEIEAPDFAALYPATLAASALLASPLCLSSPVSLP